jgi:hypothetical protein
LEYYRRTIFVRPPGLDVDAAKAVAAELTASDVRLEDLTPDGGAEPPVA